MKQLYKKTCIFISFAVCLLAGCEKQTEKWPLPLFAKLPTDLHLTCYTGNNTIFDARYSEELQTPFEELTFRWDFNGDGSWDLPFSTNPIGIYRYGKPGYYWVTLQVKNQHNQTASSKQIIQVQDSAYFEYETIYVDDELKIPAVDFFDYSNDSLSILRWAVNNMHKSMDGIGCAYNNDATNIDKHGLLYTWHDVMAITRNQLIPSLESWKNIIHLGGGKELAYLTLGENGPTMIDITFSGRKATNGQFTGLNEEGWYWTSTEADMYTAWAVRFYSNGQEVEFLKISKNEALSLRLFQCLTCN